ncbi:MAG: V-type ATP synthase subunit F [Deltaproteobacteria bacterium]|nr:V-type ATP synthase subunit F [Deltaproteobacteria bacterium]
MKELDIAIIGTRDQTALMRLAGVERYLIIDEDGPDMKEKVRSALQDFSSDASIGIIMIPDNWKEHVDDILKSIAVSKKMSTVVIGIPTGYTTEKENVKEYYQSYTRHLIAFNIEI